MTITWSIGPASSSKNSLERPRSVASKAAVLCAPTLGRGALQALAVAAGEDDVGALGAGAPGGLEPDAGAAADHDDGLPAAAPLGARSSRRSRAAGDLGAQRLQRAT